MNPVKKFVEGQKVLRKGPDWKWKDQAENSVYGVMKYSSGRSDGDDWVSVHWIDYKGYVIDQNHAYRVGPQNFDLLEYEE